MGSGMDRILLRQLALECAIGVGEEERQRPQTLLVDVEIEVDLALAATTDDVADTVDYGALARRLRAEAAGTSYRLLESLAEQIATVCLEDLRVRAVHITLTKPGAVRACQGAGVRICRTRHP